MKSPGNPTPQRASISYRTLANFVETTTLQCLLVTDTLEGIPTLGFIVQADCHLAIVPAYRLERTGLMQRPAHGFVARSYLDTLPGRLLLPKEWTAGSRHDLFMMVSLFRNVDVFDRPSNRLKDFTPTRGAYGPGGEPLNYQIAFMWAYWEHRGIKWSARALEAVEVGLYAKMEEDNLRRICRKIGLLKKHSNQPAS